MNSVIDGTVIDCYNEFGRKNYTRIFTPAEIEKRKRVMRMSAYEIIMVVLTVIGLLFSAYKLNNK